MNHGREEKTDDREKLSAVNQAPLVDSATGPGVSDRLFSSKRRIYAV